MYKLCVILVRVCPRGYAVSGDDFISAGGGVRYQLVTLVLTRVCSKKEAHYHSILARV